MKKILILPTFVILASVLSYSFHYAHATSSNDPCFILLETLKSTTDCANWWIYFSQTMALVITLAVLVWQVILQKSALSIDEYDKLREHHHDLIKLQE
jgi:hypothetical protein